MTLQSEVTNAGKDRAEMKHQFRGTVGATLPVFRMMDSETLEARQRWIIAQSRTIGNSFIIAHLTNGTIGGTIGNYRGTWATQRIVHAGNVYREWFYDDKFEATAETTATWDHETNHNVVFASGDIAQSTRIYQNGATVTEAILTSDNSGTLSFWLTANGSDWESVTSGNKHTFTNTGEDLRWRGSASSAATLDLMTIEIIT